MSEINTTSMKKLWNPRSFIIFSILFSFLPAGIMYAVNYGRCGNKKKKWTYLLSVIVGFIVATALTFIIPNNITKYAFFAVNAGLGTYFKTSQQELYSQHIQNSGKMASYLLPIIICIFVTGVIIASLIYSISIPDNYISYNKNELYYTDNITKAKAKNIGDYLQSEGLFDNNSQMGMKIDEQNNLYIFSIIINPDYLNDKKLVTSMKSLSKDLTQNIFENTKVRVDLCNSTFKVLKSINPN
ncbi:DUF1761 domain-containing protein [Clostridium akagii]|uniref:DUF1761 domain-containing protein n=1 Tax=Clostridium akagii TaxID=91623 RepID=UPI000478883B|nr:DUF1761 domain-containing protein [Clostridium akagii]